MEDTTKSEEDFPSLSEIVEKENTLKGIVPNEPIKESPYDENGLLAKNVLEAGGDERLAEDLLNIPERKNTVGTFIVLDVIGFFLFLFFVFHIQLFKTYNTKIYSAGLIPLACLALFIILTAQFTGGHKIIRIGSIPNYYSGDAYRAYPSIVFSIFGLLLLCVILVISL
jgi:hypothetical protein